MMRRVRVYVVFAGKPKGVAGWPYAELDCNGRASSLLQRVEESVPSIEFVGGDVLYSSQDIPRIISSAKKTEVDGILIYSLASFWSDYSLSDLLNLGYPTIITTDLYGGEQLALEAYDLVKRKRLPVVPVFSSEADDLKNTLRLFDVIGAIKNQKIIVIEDSRQVDDASHFWRRAYDEYIAAAREVLGIQIIALGSEAIIRQYENTKANEAEKIAEEWITKAKAIVEPNKDEVIKSARLYLAMQALMAEYDVIGITIDCLNLFYSGKLPAYPCLGYFQLNNEGKLGVCEADLEATITQLIGHLLTGRPGFVSDPVIDQASSQIIYAHCVCHNRPWGKRGPEVGYRIRSHAEDRKGASVQTLLPAGHPLTTVKINLMERKLAIHQARSVGNVDEERACRTKLAAEANVGKILKNWDYQTFGWHRVTFYGDFRKDFLDLATLLGIEAVEEDR